MEQTRPKFNYIKSGSEFINWYWLKSELVEISKNLGIPYSGSKQEITDLIAFFIDHGKLPSIQRTKKKKSSSSFNWTKATLFQETIITDSYKNGPNVRNFFQSQIGSRFKFNIEFMAWMKTNTGKTLQDAVDTWLEIEKRSKKPGFKSTIPSSNQYNKYTRDFFKDNPNASIQEARESWKKKRSIPGHNRYERSDLEI